MWGEEREVGIGGLELGLGLVKPDLSNFGADLVHCDFHGDKKEERRKERGGERGGGEEGRKEGEKGTREKDHPPLVLSEDVIA